MRVLVLDEEFPYPANSGKRTRSFNLYSRLAARFHIRYIGYGEDGSPAAAALRRAGIEPVAVRPSVPPKHGIAFYLRLLANDDDHWRARFAAPPVSLKRYGWRPEDRGWLAKHKKSMAVVDMALNSAVMLPPEEKLPRQKVTAAGVAWAKCEDKGDSNG